VGIISFNVSNTILTHYAKKLELSQKADKFLAEIRQESGFAPEKEIWRGLILGDAINRV